MKRFFTLPEDQEFYQRYAGLIQPLKKIGASAQLVSALTEVGAIYALIYSATVLLFPVASPVISLVGAAVGTGLLEIGLHKFAPYSVRSILNKRFKGLDLVMTIFIIAATFFLVGASGYLSFSNSQNIVETFTPKAEEKTTEAARLQEESKSKEIASSYTRDSLELASSYKTQIEAQESQAKSKVEAEVFRAENYRKKEERTGRIYITRISQAEQKVKEVEASRDEEIAALTTSKARDYKRLNERRLKETKTIEQRFESERLAVEQFNQDAKQERENKVASYGLGLGWFTLFSLTIFLITVTLKEVYNKGAGIKESFIATQYDFSDSIIADWWEAVTTRAKQKARERIKKIEDSTEAPPLPSLPVPLYDLTDIANDKVEVKREGDDGKKLKVIYLNDDFRRKHQTKANDNRRPDDNRRSHKLRVCEHCSEEYTYKHHKQKYCKDACRQDAWEIRTGKKLKQGRV
jgi:hypothetical protein